MGKDAAGTVYSSPSFWGRMLESIPASYTIWKDTTTTPATYMAECNLKGGTDYSDADASTVIQAAIDACPNYGLTALKGPITLTDTITLDNYKSLTFDYLELSDKTKDGVFVDGGAAVTFYVRSKLIGNTIKLPADYEGSAIKIRNTIYLKVDVLAIYADGAGVGAVGSAGVHFIGNVEGACWNDVYAGVIRNVESGILLETTAGGSVNGNRLYNADILYAKYGVKQLNNGATISGNVFIGLTVNGIGNGDYGFYNIGGGNEYFGCKTIDATGTAVDFWNSGTAHLFGCQFVNSTVTNTGTIQHYACHYSGTGKLENAGAAANVADGGTIAHGVDTTPTWATAQASVAGELASVTGIDGANITVAIKTHAGAAGTAQTIYWRAKKEF